MKRYLQMTLLLALIFWGCSEDSTGPDENGLQTQDYDLLQQDYTDGLKIELYSKEMPAVGFNTLYALVSDSITNDILEDIRVDLMPMMDMGTMMHRSPYMHHGKNNDGLYATDVVFIMSGMWQVTAQFQFSTQQLEHTFMIDVAASQRVKAVDGSDGARYFLTLKEPRDPQVGLNDIELCLHKRETMMNFPAVENATLHMEPTMPSMGHGSPNNVDPVHDANGLYRGTVNFTMTGDWRVDVAVLSAGDTLFTSHFDFLLE